MLKNYWRDGRAVDCNGLENRRRRKPFASSNLALSATLRGIDPVFILTFGRKTHARRINKLSNLVRMKNCTRKPRMNRGCFCVLGILFILFFFSIFSQLIHGGKAQTLGIAFISCVEYFFVRMSG